MELSAIETIDFVMRIEKRQVWGVRINGPAGVRFNASHKILPPNREGAQVGGAPSRFVCSHYHLERADVRAQRSI
jgi:hypothetical protein